MTTEREPAPQPEMRPLTRVEQKMLELQAHKERLKLEPRPGMNPRRRIRRALAKAAGVSPKKMRKIAKQNQREMKAQIAALKARTAVAPDTTAIPDQEEA